MPPAKRSLPKQEPIKSNIPTLCYCCDCQIVVRKYMKKFICVWKELIHHMEITR